MIVTITSGQRTISAYINKGAISDHTELSNIGVKTHATLDTEVDLNTAKVTFPEAPNDGTQYARKDAGWEAVASSGGVNNYFYRQTLWIDSPNASNWVSQVRGDLSNNEYNYLTNVAKTVSMATVLGSNLKNIRPFSVVSGNQTIEQLELWAGFFNQTGLEKISIVKVSWTSEGVINSISVLYDGVATVGVDGALSIPSTSFADTSLSDKDLIYIFFATSTTSDVSIVTINLKTTID